MHHHATAELVTRRGRKLTATSKDPFGHRLGVGSGKPDNGQRTGSRGRGQRRYHIQTGHPVFTRAARAWFSRPWAPPGSPMSCSRGVGSSFMP